MLQEDENERIRGKGPVPGNATMKGKGKKKKFRKRIIEAVGTLENKLYKLVYNYFNKIKNNHNTSQLMTLAVPRTNGIKTKDYFQSEYKSHQLFFRLYKDDF